MLDALAFFSCLPSPFPARDYVFKFLAFLLYLREAHDVEYPIQLVVVIGVAGFDVFLSEQMDIKR